MNDSVTRIIELAQLYGIKVNHTSPGKGGLYFEEDGQLIECAASMDIQVQYSVFNTANNRENISKQSYPLSVLELAA